MFSSKPRCQIVPLPDREVAFAVDGVERLRWNASKSAPRPFFYPLLGPSGLPLTRMGHPGASNHDHHRSVWFAHHRVLGIDFWSDQTTARIEQRKWHAYIDGDQEALMAVELAWYDGHDPQPLILQDLVVSLAPASNDEIFLEIQTSLRSTSESLELGVTNFGLLAVRVAKKISAVFGNGVLTGSSGRQGEQDLFGQPLEWVDYSGEVKDDCIEGITYFDHPSNSTFPSKWHVRDDGWMGASICRDKPVLLRQEVPVTWRYLLHAHSGKVDHRRAKSIADMFAQRAPLEIMNDPRPHYEATVRRVD